MSGIWVYSQSSGRTWDPSGLVVGNGYSGYRIGKNNPSFEADRNVGPIPRGLYVMGRFYHSRKVGRLAIPLIPHSHNAHGRTDFLIHGDSLRSPGEASKGCIVIEPSIRRRMSKDQKRILLVIE